MIKLLVIDDEQATRRGLIKHIDWFSLDIDRVEEARDGLEGLEVAQRFQPDIIISDIYMPGLNGIELAHRIKELFPICKMIFLSGYSDKEYLKAAISLNVVSYIEKPINLDEVRAAVSKAVAQHKEEEGKRHTEKKMVTVLSESMPLIKRNLITGLINRKTTGSGLMEELGLIGIAFEPKDAYVVIIMQMTLPQEQTSDDNQKTSNEALHLAEECLHEVKHICALEDHYHMVVILSALRPFTKEKLQAYIKGLELAIKQGFPTLDLFFAVGRTVLGIEQIFLSYETALSALGKLFFRGFGSIVFYEKKTEEPMCLKGVPTNFGELLQKQDKEKLVSFIENLCREISQHQETAINDIRNIFFSLTYLLFQESERRGIGINDAMMGNERYIWSQISKYETLEELKGYLLDNVSILFDRLDGLQSTGRNVFKVLEYIRKNYASCSLSNKMLAEHVYLTPAYLSALFRKETGKTISDYIIEVRVERSKELLKKPRIKLMEVAQQVGYSDANYYAKVFKKQVGLTPSEFREKYKI